MLAALTCLFIACAPAVNVSGIWMMVSEGTGYRWVLSLTQTGSVVSATAFRGNQTAFGRYVQGWKKLPVPRAVHANIEDDDEATTRR